LPPGVDGPAGIAARCAGGGIALRGSWRAVPLWLVYGVLYGSACDSRWHECGHCTAFRSAWMNAAGLTTRGGFADADAALWDRRMAVNARAPFLLMAGALADMR